MNHELDLTTLGVGGVGSMGGEGLRGDGGGWWRGEGRAGT